MKRILATGGLLLTFALGCGSLGGGEEEAEVSPPPPAPTSTETHTPSPDGEQTTNPGSPDAADPSGADAEVGGIAESCCCEYRDEGSTTPKYDEMAKSNCTSWGFACVADDKCAEAEEEEAEEEEEATAPRPAPRPTSTRMTRPRGSGTRSGGDGVTRPR